MLESALTSSSATDGKARGTVLARMLGLADSLTAFIATAALAPVAGVEPLDSLILGFGASLIWPAIAFSLGLYRTDDLRSWASGVGAVSKLMVGGIALPWPVYGLAKVIDAPDPVLTAALTSAVTALFSVFARAFVRLIAHRHPAFRQRTVIIGSGVVAETLIAKLRANDQFGLVCTGIVDDDLYAAGILSHDVPYLGGFDVLPRVIESGYVDRVIIAFTRSNHEALLSTIRACRDKSVAIDIVPRLFDFLEGVDALEYVGGLPLMSIGMPQLSRSARIAKRSLDLTVSTTLLLVLGPVLLTIALLIRLESRGPALFKQSRVGLGGRSFDVLKFRSMVSDADQRKHEVAERNDLADGVMFKIHRDPRMTRIGRHLRRSSLDELPQLINVLKGDMSLVGPRPLIAEEANALTDPWQVRRLELRPGMTGPWQTSGRSNNSFEEMVRLDYQYVAAWSLARDLEILLATIPAVVSARGAF